MKRIIRITESKLNSIISNSIRSVIMESFYDNDTATFQLNSPMNGNLLVRVPYREFMQTKNKLDYLWSKCAEQNTIQKMRNGYFTVASNDPHRAEIERVFN